MATFGSLKSAIYDKEERKQQYQAHIRGLNAYDRHKKFVHDYVSFYGKEKSTSVKLPVKTDHDTLREGYRFIRTEEDDMDRSWEQRLVKRYYDKLFKECAEKLNYKNRKEKDKLEKKDKEEHKQKRERSRTDDDTDDEEEREEKKKGKRSSLSGHDHKADDDDDDDNDDDENFDEFLKGMFP